MLTYFSCCSRNRNNLCVRYFLQCRNHYLSETVPFGSTETEFYELCLVFREYRIQYITDIFLPVILPDSSLNSSTYIHFYCRQFLIEEAHVNCLHFIDYFSIVVIPYTQIIIYFLFQLLKAQMQLQFQAYSKFLFLINFHNPSFLFHSVGCSFTIKFSYNVVL